MFRDKKNSLKIEKQEAVLSVYFSWIDLYQKGIMVSEYLKEKGYKRIAIYGLGRLGQNLFTEIRNSKMNVEYCIDRNVSMKNGNYGGVKCYHPMSKLPEADLIIITVPYEAAEISEELKKTTECYVIGIDELLCEVRRNENKRSE